MVQLLREQSQRSQEDLLLLLFIQASLIILSRDTDRPLSKVRVRKGRPGRGPADGGVSASMVEPLSAFLCSSFIFIFALYHPTLPSTIPGLEKLIYVTLHPVQTDWFSEGCMSETFVDSIRMGTRFASRHIDTRAWRHAAVKLGF